MSKTPPGFFFYPGDYLRDTQCLSEKCQVAYDRLMCEHMRKISKDKTNIHVSQETLDFFTKRLSVEEKEELMHVLQKVEGGYQIEWVSLSISKSKNYSESRAKNRSVKNKEDTITHVKTSEHMEEEEGYVYNIIVDSTKEVINNLKEENKNVLENSNLFRQPKIPTKKEVLEVFDRSVSDKVKSKEMARAFWDKYEGLGWFINGSPVVNFASMANKFITNWNSNNEDKKYKQKSDFVNPTIKSEKEIDFDKYRAKSNVIS